MFKKQNFDYDLVVIGSGAAGGTAALMAAGAGLKTAIVEAKQWGGTNVNRRDIPYAAASYFSQTYANARLASRFGMSTENAKYNYPTVSHWRKLACKRAGAGSKKEFEDAGVTCLDGFANFLSPFEISVGNGGRISAKNFIIATGTEPLDNKITTNMHCLLPEEALDLPKIPKVTLVVGGGPTGCEVAEYLAEMGSKVLLVEISERLLPKEDPEVGEVIETRLTKVLGVKVLTQSRVQAVIQDGKVAKVTFIRGAQEKAVRVESVVFCTGSKPATDLGLDNAGVKFGKNGIEVSQTLQTSVKHIYAAGDVAHTPIPKLAANKRDSRDDTDPNEISSTEKASYQAAIATTNIVNKNKTIADYRGFVRTVGTMPSVAAIGLTEDECMKRDLKYKQELTPINMVSASNTNDFHDGFVKIVVDRDRNILGASVVTPNADLVIQEITFAMKYGHKISDVANMPHVATGWAEAVRICARRLAK